MKVLNKRGFTLIELLATIIILSIIIGISGYAIVGLINDSKEKNYLNFVEEIKNATEKYYIECTYSKNSMISCPNIDGDGFYKIMLKDLVTYGYLKSNSGDNVSSGVVNPKDNEKVDDCEIKYKYIDGKFIFDNVASTNTSCPVVG